MRVDADASIGAGHFTRCLALAQAWRDRRGEVIFVTTCKRSELLNRLKEEGIGIRHITAAYPDKRDLEETLTILSDYPLSWVVLDGYHFGSSYQKKIRKTDHRTMCIDDTASLEQYHADVVLNQNIHAHDLQYNCLPVTKLLFGTEFALLQRVFLDYIAWEREIPDVGRHLLVTMGGADKDNITLKVLEALHKITDDRLEVVIAVGAENPHDEAIKSAVKRLKVRVRLMHDVINMAELMAWADVAISAAGSTSWELAFMGLPSLLCVSADNQFPIANKLHAGGVAACLGWHEDLCVEKIATRLSHLMMDVDHRSDMSRRGRLLVDGGGVLRVIDAMRRVKIKLRDACEDDCEMILEWANEPAVRSASFSSEPIPWEAHLAWFQKKLTDTSAYFFIVLDEEDRPIGQVRFDVKADDTAHISASVHSKERCRGYGSLSIDLAVNAIFRKTSVHTVHAYIKEGNHASLRAFGKASFKKQGMKKVRNFSAYDYVRVRKRPANSAGVHMTIEEERNKWFLN